MKPSSDTIIRGRVNTPSDLELLQAWRAGNERAGDRLVQRHFPRVYSFFRHKAEGVAEDLAQKTFMAAVEARVRVDPERGFKPYLFGIARHVLFRHFRDHQRRDSRHVGGDVSLEELGPSPSRQVAAKEERRLLIMALRKLPIDHQIAIELYYWEEMSVRDVAQVLEVAEGTVRSRLARARERLREIIEAAPVEAAVRDATLTSLDAWARALEGERDD